MIPHIHLAIDFGFAIALSRDIHVTSQPDFCHKINKDRLNSRRSFYILLYFTGHSTIPVRIAKTTA
jgi:hypothetical protein